MRIKLFALVAALAVVAAAYFGLRPVVVPEEPGPEPCVGHECGPMADTAEETLAQRYAPIVYMANRVTDCDREVADFRPVPVEAILGNADVALRHRSGREPPKMGPTAADLYNLGEDYFLDLPGNPRRPGCRFVQDARNVTQDQPNVAYARITSEEDFDELVLQYWFFYYFNQWNNKHEGDWEMIQLVFEAGSADEALDVEPERIGYSQHSSGELAVWDDDKLELEGDRPVVRVAAGSHSNHYSPHVFIGRAEQGAGFGCDRATGETRLPVEVRMMPETVTGPDDPYAWLTFSGRWGQLAGPEFDGPTGPNEKRQWDEPLSWEADLRASSVRVPAHDQFGPDAVQTFCDIVEWGSNLLLPIYLQLPEISIAVVGLIGVGMVLSLSRTRYVPPIREPLRARRRLGQILVSSWTIYARNLRLFIGIGLVILPVTLLVSLLHWLFLEVSPSETIVPLPRGDFALELILAFALSELHFGVAYAIVLTACLAALDALEEGRPIDVPGAYLDVWCHLKQLLLPRLLAAAVITLLALTVIGIPLAIRRAIHWSFIEQAVLLDEKDWRGAMSTSRETASVDWWWTAGAVLSLGAIGLFAAPVFGAVLILLARSIPLANINLLATALHVALVPYVAIALALAYFDLRARLRQEEPETGNPEQG